MSFFLSMLGLLILIGILLFVIEHWKFVLVLIAILIVGGIVTIYIYLDKQDDEACQQAKEANTIESWQAYLEDYPDGNCANEAKQAPKQIDKNACEKAKSKNKYGWKKYLEEFPEGTCADKAKSRLEELRTSSEISFTEGKPKKDLKNGFMWSDKPSNEKRTLQKAKNYCEDLIQYGYSDWRLPNIDELRTLIQYCQKTETNGECKVSEKNNCLNSDCWYPENSCSCSTDEDERYSKLEDVEEFWSSSPRADGENFAWYVDFSKGYIDAKDSNSKLAFLCIRGGSGEGEQHVEIEEKQPVTKENESPQEEASENPTTEESENNDLQPMETYE